VAVVAGDEGHGDVRLLNTAGRVCVIEADPSAPLVNRSTEGIGVFFDDIVDVENTIGCLNEHRSASLGAQEIQLFLSAHLLEGFGRSGTTTQRRDNQGGQRGCFQEQSVNRRPTVRFPSGNLGMHLMPQIEFENTSQSQNGAVPNCVCAVFAGRG
jgi:hypothetical protein